MTPFEFGNASTMAMLCGPTQSFVQATRIANANLSLTVNANTHTHTQPRTPALTLTDATAKASQVLCLPSLSAGLPGLLRGRLGPVSGGGA